MSSERDIQKESGLRISRLLRSMYWVFLGLSVAIIVKIIWLQAGWVPDPELERYFLPTRYEEKETPERGAVMDRNGNLLAISIPLYNINMDCTILKDDFAKVKDKRKRDSLENAWMDKARMLSRELPKVLAKDGKTSDYYYDLIRRNRQSRLNGRKNVPITRNIDHSTYLELRSLPLFNEGQFRSGMIKTEVQTRQYPYGSLASRVIGDVRINIDNPQESRFLGIEGQYDYILRGKEGSQWMKRTDKGSIADPDSTIVKVNHGSDIRTTLDISIQEIADKALRKNIESDPEISGGCVVVMDVKTGAVRAMVNLQKNKKGELGENFNMAVGRSGEPGSIFKTATLMTLLEEGKTTLSSVYKTNNGIMEDFTDMKPCEETRRYEKNTGKKTITVEDALKVSSNYIFRRIVADNYMTCPDEFVDRLYEYHLHDSFTFDLTEKGGTSPSLPKPDLYSHFEYRNY